MSHARQRGRHRRTRMLAVAPAVAAVAVGGAIGAAQPAGAGDVFAQIRQCESGNNYSTNTGNGFYGAYQFTQGTWQSLGYSGLPSNASPATQDEAARRLAARSGLGQWPVCGRGGGGYQASAPTTTSTSSTPKYRSSTTSYKTYKAYKTSTHAYTHRVARRHTHATPVRSHVYAHVKHVRKAWNHPLFTTALAGQVRADVRAWQQAMVDKGYSLPVDGRYGARSAAVARAFQIQRGLLVDGVVGPQTWGATFGS